MSMPSIPGMGGGGGGGMGSVLGAYGANVNPQPVQPQVQQPQLVHYANTVPQPKTPQQMQGPQQQVTPQQVFQPQQPQQWGIQMGTGNTPGVYGEGQSEAYRMYGDMLHEPGAANNRGISQVRGQAAGNAARQSSLATAVQNFQKAQSLNAQPSSQSSQAQPASRGPNQPSLADLTRQLQADTAKEQASQQYTDNPNYQWANQQAVNPQNMGDMDQAENYVNQNANTPASLLGNPDPSIHPTTFYGGDDNG